MANTRGAAKRARQALKRRARNAAVESSTKTAVKNAVKAIQSKNLELAKDAYVKAVKFLNIAASKGVLPQNRIARKISRLTLLTKKVLPEALNFKN